MMSKRPTFVEEKTDVTRQRKRSVRTACKADPSRYSAQEEMMEGPQVTVCKDCSGVGAGLKRWLRG